MKHTVIWQQNHAALVEWRDQLNNLQRSIIPSESAMSELTLTELAAGIPFGANWEILLTESLAQRLANRLRERGIWTYANAANNIRDFRAIVNEVVAASLLDAARGGK